MVVTKHRRTDPACRRFSGAAGTTWLGRWLFERGRGKSCPVCFPGLWTCHDDRGCGWTNTREDAACQRCGHAATDGYGFRL